MSICEVLLSNPDKLLAVFDAAMVESQSVTMSDHPHINNMVIHNLYGIVLLHVQ
jgi:hypothetical protein